MRPRLRELAGCLFEAALMVGFAGLLGAMAAAAMWGWSMFLWWVSQ